MRTLLLVVGILGGVFRSLSGRSTWDKSRRMRRRREQVPIPRARSALSMRQENNQFGIASGIR